MFMLVFMIMIIISLSLIVILMGIFISKKTFSEFEKSSPIECGMNTLNSSSTPFSIQFFIIAILFMIFDVEIALLLPIPLSYINNMNMFYMTTNFFLIILLIGLFYEWINGALEWSK